MFQPSNKPTTASVWSSYKSLMRSLYTTNTKKWRQKNTNELLTHIFEGPPSRRYKAYRKRLRSLQEDHKIVWHFGIYNVSIIIEITIVKLRHLRRKDWHSRLVHARISVPPRIWVRIRVWANPFLDFFTFRAFMSGKRSTKKG